MNKIILIGLISGSLVSICLSLILVNEVPLLISEFFPILAGTFLSGVIIKDKPILIGIIIPVIQFAISLLILFLVVTTTAGEFSITYIKNMKIWLQWCFYLPFGLTGAYAGTFLGKMGNK